MGTLGLRGPNPRQGGDHPGPALGENTSWGEQTTFACSAGVNESLRASGPGKQEKNVGKEARPHASLYGSFLKERSIQTCVTAGLFSDVFLLLSWARSPQAFRSPSAAGGACPLSPASKIARSGVQGNHSPAAGFGAA